MGKNVTLVIFVIVMAAIVVSVDVLFFRHRFWERLIANIVIALVFITLYVNFLKR